MKTARLDTAVFVANNIKGEFRQELSAITDWWLKHVVDIKKNAFAGEVDDDNVANPLAHKSAVFTTRLLWFFSEMARIHNNSDCAAAADCVYQYLNNHFLDKEFNGIYWEVDAVGRVANPRKQVYAQAFFIYSLCAYYRLTRNQDALSKAMDIFGIIEARAHDNDKEGYVEALSRNWGPQDDLRLSEKEPNLPKTMNTHLHILEAYTALHAVVLSKETAFSLKRILGYFIKYFISRETGHLRIFFDNDWNDRSTGYSFGHDIEATWLLWEAAEVLHDTMITAQLKELIPVIAQACIDEGTGEYNELLDGYNFASKQIISEHIWWVQAEALVGYLNAYQLTGQTQFAKAFEQTWGFIKQHQKNNQSGEWHWYSPLDLPHKQQLYKAGFWKGPYHNGRAMMEVGRRLQDMMQMPN